ncbi:MAG: DNA-processing protein DprA [Microbacterium sp.]
MTAIDLTPAVAGRSLALVAPVDGWEAEQVVEQYARVVWSHLTEPGDGVAGRLVTELGAAAALRRITAGAVGAIAGLSGSETAKGRSRWMPRLSAEAIDVSLRIARTAGVRLVTPDAAVWPAQLDDLGEHAPLCLWVRGDPAILTRLRPSVALVGARAATSYGDHVAMDLAADLAGSGVPIVSGAAYGIDGAAHRAALAVGGTTVALLAGGAERPYPVGHSGLIERIASSGLVVSEVPCGSAPTKWRFLQRNRLIAALADATVVVEAGWRSGSLNTAGHAATLSRALGAVPGPVTSAASAGAHRLFREFGAHCITSGDDVRELLGLGVSTAIVSDEGRPRTDDATRVRDALSRRATRAPEDLARRSGMGREDVEVILGLLLLEGEVERDRGGWRLVRATPPESLEVG